MAEKERASTARARFLATLGPLRRSLAETRARRSDPFGDGGALAEVIKHGWMMHELGSPRPCGEGGASLEEIARGLAHKNYGVRLWGALLDLVATWRAWTRAARTKEEIAKKESNLRALDRLVAVTGASADRKAEAAGGGAFEAAFELGDLLVVAGEVGWPYVHSIGGGTLGSLLAAPLPAWPGSQAALEEATRAWREWEAALRGPARDSREKLFAFEEGCGR